MKKIFMIILAIILTLTLSINVFGSSPVGFGARAAGMGGAFTAVADDGAAAYWNPAGINQLGIFTLTPGIGAYGAYDSNINFDSLKNCNTFPPPIPNGNLGIPAFAGITTKYFGANVFGDFSVDKTDDSSVTKINSDGNAYGMITSAASFGKLIVGVSYKIVQGGMAQFDMVDVNLDPAYLQAHPSEILPLLDPDNNTSIIATGNGYAVDIGLLYKLTDKVKLGFTGRNLISSVNWTGTSSTYVLDQNELVLNHKVVFIQQQTPYSAVTSLPRTFDLGISYQPFKSTLLAWDVEVISSDDDPDLNQTRLHLGFEQNLLWHILALRLGAFTDKDQVGLGLTAGFGLKLGPVVVDLAAIQYGNSNLGIFATAGIRF